MPARWPAVLLSLAMVLATGCGARVERSGIDGQANVADPVDTTDWAEVTDEPAVERLTVGGSVVVKATEQVTASGLARIIDLPLIAGDPVRAGDVVAVLQPTTPAIEAFTEASAALTTARAAAEGPLSSRPSPELIAELVANRDAAAAGIANEQETPREPVEVMAASDGVVVSISQPLGGLVDTSDVIVAIGPMESVEVHVTVPVAQLDLFLTSADTATMIERADTPRSEAVRLAPESERVVRSDDDTAILRMLFQDTPRVTEGQRVDVEVVVPPDPDATSVPVDAVRSFAGITFVLVEQDTGFRRVDVEVTRLGERRVEVVGALERNDRVLRR